MWPFAWINLITERIHQSMRFYPDSDPHGVKIMTALRAIWNQKKNGQCLCSSQFLYKKKSLPFPEKTHFLRYIERITTGLYGQITDSSPCFHMQHRNEKNSLNEILVGKSVLILSLGALVPATLDFNRLVCLAAVFSNICKIFVHSVKCPLYDSI